MIFVPLNSSFCASMMKSHILCIILWILLIWLGIMRSCMNHSVPMNLSLLIHWKNVEDNYTGNLSQQKCLQTLHAWGCHNHYFFLCLKMIIIKSITFLISHEALKTLNKNVLLLIRISAGGPQTSLPLQTATLPRLRHGAWADPGLLLAPAALQSPAPSHRAIIPFQDSEKN